MSLAATGGGAPGPTGPVSSSTATATTTPKQRRTTATGGTKQTHSRSYPRGVGVDFRKLAGLTLLNYIDHHGTDELLRLEKISHVKSPFEIFLHPNLVVFRFLICHGLTSLFLLVVSLSLLVFVLFLVSRRNRFTPPTRMDDAFQMECVVWLAGSLARFQQGVPVRAEAPPSELAVAVARHFEQMEIDEEECIGGFLERLEQPSGVTSYARETHVFDGKALSIQVRKRKRNKWAARPGEQVAAKVTRTDENGSWILASVQRFYPDTETYDVQDEDDTSKLIRLPWTHVMRLSTGMEGIFAKGKDCMAIFPETTSFYRAKVSKDPVWKLERTGGGIPMVKEIIVKFEDDEDLQGRTPHRRVPSRYVIPVPQDYFYEDFEDVDLSLAGGKK